MDTGALELDYYIMAPKKSTYYYYWSDPWYRFRLELTHRREGSTPILEKGGGGDGDDDDDDNNGIMLLFYDEIRDFDFFQ